MLWLNHFKKNSVNAQFIVGPMDPQASYIPVKNDDAQRNVSSSSSMSEISSAATAEGAPGNSDEKDNKLVERVQGIALGAGSSSSKTEWTTSTASIHLTTSVSNKAGVFEEEEEGELDYEEDEGDIHGVQEDRNGVKNDADGDKEEGELEEDEQEEEGEEGEIISDDDDNKVIPVPDKWCSANSVPDKCYLFIW